MFACGSFDFVFQLFDLRAKRIVLLCKVYIYIYI